MNNESAPETHAFAAPGTVIKPWLNFGLIIALAGNVLFSAILIIKLSGFDDMKRRADETEVEAAKKRTELSSLQADVASLSKQKEVLAPTIEDWEKRIKEKAAAEAALANLEGKQQQVASDIVQAGKHLEEISHTVLDSEKQKTDLDSTIEKLNAELFSLSKKDTDTKALLTQASEAERRLDDATNALASADAHRKQSEADAAAAKSHLDQLQKEAEEIKQQVTTAEAQIVETKAQQQKATSELAQITNRVEQARSQTTELETKRDTDQQAGTKAAQDLVAAKKTLIETQSAQDQLSTEQAKLIAQIAALKKDLDQSRKDAADSEVRLETAKADFQNADADLSATRKLSQELSVKQGELTREVSGLEANIERLKKEKEALEKEVGRMEGQQPKPPSAGK